MQLYTTSVIQPAHLSVLPLTESSVKLVPIESIDAVEGHSAS
jgi:hypothetical protein